MDISGKILSDITVYMKYAKYLPELKRRETWEEICDRNMNMHVKKYPQLEEEITNVYKNYVVTKKVLPSMRSLQFGGKSIELSNNRLFNCSFLPVNHYKAFSEMMFLLLGGTGVGFSVQKLHIKDLPVVRQPYTKRRWLISDSIEGWADAVNTLVKAYMCGKPEPIFDYMDIREKGATLKTSGGKAPGPEPLQHCLVNLNRIFKSVPDGKRLTPLQVHDVVCYIADSVLLGGTRRAALISLFDIDDQEMLNCKTGNWFNDNPQRARSNNSAVVVRHKVTKEDFEDLWEKIRTSGCGEPGFYFTNNAEWGLNPCKPLRSTILTPEGYITFEQALKKDKLTVIGENGQHLSATKPFKTGTNREVMRVKLSNGCWLYGTPNHQHKIKNGEWVEMKDLKTKDKLIIKDLLNKKFISGTVSVEVIEREHSFEDVYDITVNDPSHAFIDSGIVSHNCSEIALKPFSFCNLSEINMSDIQTQEELNLRSKVASFIGTLQAGYTNFHYLRNEWKEATEKEALIGVSGTGIASGNIFKLDLKAAAVCVKKENERVAKLIGINKAARTTCVKPAGTTSCVLGTSSGIHAWYDPFFIRRIRVNKMENIYNYLARHNPDLIEDEINVPCQAVISFPMKAPSNAIFRNESAIALLERIKYFDKNWIKPGHRKGDNTHNVSATVYIKDHEWDEVKEWMWNNRDAYNGLTVLPYNGGSYKQTPFETCDKAYYDTMVKKIKDIDLTEVKEMLDNTNLEGEIACAGGVCAL
jgi:hypothetical protein